MAVSLTEAKRTRKEKIRKKCMQNIKPKRCPTCCNQGKVWDCFSGYCRKEETLTCKPYPKCLFGNIFSYDNSTASNFDDKNIIDCSCCSEGLVWDPLREECRDPVTFPCEPYPICYLELCMLKYV